MVPEAASERRDTMLRTGSIFEAPRTLLFDRHGGDLTFVQYECCSRFSRKRLQSTPANTLDEI